MSITPDTRLPDDVHERIREAHRRRAAEEQAEVTSALRALQARYRAERSRLITPDTAQKLHEYADAHRPAGKERLDPDARGRFSAANVVRARELGVDLGALDRLRADVQRQYQAIVGRGTADSGEPLAEAEGASAAGPATTDAVTTVFRAPWHGSWQPGTQRYTTDPSHTTWIDQSPSHWDQNSRMGSHIGFNRRPADNDDAAWTTHSSGYLVNYTMPSTSRLEITLGMTRQFARHFIDTDDEFGPSSCDVRVSESAVAEVYWDWNDWTADSRATRALTTSYAWRPEQWVDVHQAPGFRSATLYNPNVVFPQGHTVVVFAALELAASAWVDDVAVRADVNAAWILNWITITPR